MNKILEIFTDGACINNGREPAYAGFGLYFHNKECRSEISRPFVSEPITNQRAELYAIYKALAICKRMDFFKTYSKIIIHTDSMYSINIYTDWIYKWIANDWKKSKNSKDYIKNKDIIFKTWNIYCKNIKKIEFKHVKAHTKNTDYISLGNKIADKLANDGAKEHRKIQVLMSLGVMEKK